MKTIGLFEAKTKLSEICEEVSQSGQSVLVTRRGKPLVQIDPIVDQPQTIRERRSDYMARNAQLEANEEAEFEPGKRSNEIRNIDLDA